MSAQALTNAPDLRKDFPRSPNANMGYFVLLPRIIDKCRATIAGLNGYYNYNCPLDRQFFDFWQVDAEAFKAEVASGKSDEDLLAWIKSNSRQMDETEIKAWSYRMRWRRPETDEMRAYFEDLRFCVAPENYAIETWFQLLDADEGRF